MICPVNHLPRAVTNYNHNLNQIISVLGDFEAKKYSFGYSVLVTLAEYCTWNGTWATFEELGIVFGCQPIDSRTLFRTRLN